VERAPALALPVRGSNQPLIAFADRRLRQRAGAKFAALYATGVGISYGIFILLAAGADAERAARGLVLRELGTATWIVGGLLCLSLAANWEKIDQEEGVLGLLRLRGLPLEGLEAARWFAGARRLALLLGLPAVLSCALAGARVRSLHSAAEVAVLIVAVAVYACVVAAGASGLALAARKLLPSSGRLLLAALVLLPHAARELWPHVPSVPAAVSWLLTLVGRAGGLNA
jgi:hypothetical protein